MRVLQLIFIHGLLFLTSYTYSQTLEECFQKNDSTALKKIITMNNPSALLQTNDSVALFLTDIADWFVEEYKSDRERVFRVRGDGLNLRGERLITIGADSILTGYMNRDDFEIDKILKRTGRVMNGLGLSNSFTDKKWSAYKVSSKSGGIKISNSFKRAINSFLNNSVHHQLVDGQQRADFLGNHLSGLRQSNRGRSINGKIHVPWYFHPVINFEAVYFDYRHTMALVVYQYANFKQECYLKRNNSNEWIFDEKGQSITYD